jgi:hypothetical protein
MASEAERGTTIHQLAELVTSQGRRMAVATILALCLLVGLLGGALLGFLGPLLTAALVVALVAGLLMLRSTQWGLVTLLGLICLFPYGTLPFKVGFTPTFLDLAMLAVFLVWAASLVSGRQQQFIGTSLGMPVFVFLLWCVLTFVAGLAHAPLTANVLRHFIEMLISVSFFYAVVNCVWEREQLERLTLVILLAGTAAAALGLLLYFIPSEWTVRLLSSLSRFGYPEGSGILRYIEDDPAQPMRAISTSIDPNAFGGLLVLVATVIGAQLLSPRPLLRRPLVAAAFAIALAALALTFSRGSMLGLAAALLFLGLLRYRRLLPVLLLAALLLLLLPQTQSYVQRFVEGLQGQDLATQMRFGEYKDALILISRYPFLGVGFSSPPDIDIYLGVSNLYLMIAEQVGLVGLGLFLVVMADFFLITLRTWRRANPDPGLEGVLLGYAAAVAGVLVSGVFDHFFFNINFIHLVAFFWIVLGLTVAAARLGEQTRNTQYDERTRLWTKERLQY